jgi:hypothetical protein
MPKQREKENGFKLIVPFDASQIEDFQPGQEIKVVAQGDESHCQL